ncbi:hypothetical protein [Shewanella baltica]|uniref:Mannitol repressor n=1 Tax=Shewanella baltica (strain OS195) TaxID=399599 RepID=A9L6C3_SHEB9|nr:hypothetical protein [Shewanella baltica]ABX51705.1 conserved hypothetical protein [Shewanella baltica OS195]
MDDSLTKTFKEFMEIILEESDRGSVLVAVSMIEDVLGCLLKARLLPSLDKNDELFDIGYAPFGTFSAKIDLAYRVGCINQHTRQSCHILRKIRNDFAHATNIKGFSHSCTQDRIKDLFSLNKVLVSSYEELLVNNSEKLDNPIESFNDFIDKFGWRFGLELLFAGLAAGMKNDSLCIEPIELADANRPQ